MKLINAVQFICLVTILSGCSSSAYSQTELIDKGNTESTKSIEQDPKWVKETINSMMLPNDEKLLGAPTGPSWSLHGNVIQGVPKGEAAPYYWVDAIKAGGDKNAIQYTKGEWSAITSWFVVFPGINNPVTDKEVKVAIGNVNLWVLYADPDYPTNVAKAQWKEVISPSLPTWAGNYDSNLVDYKYENINQSSNDNYAVYAIDGDYDPIHGGTAMHCIQGVGTDGSCLKEKQILGVFARAKAWLVDAEPNSSVLLSIGADYYPDKTVSSSDLTGAGYLPGAAGSRFKHLTTKPQWFYMGNVINPHLIDSRGDLYFEPNNEYSKQGGKTYLLKSEFINNLPNIRER